MDTRCKGISWLENIENIYLKFEDLCLEVAERMEQEMWEGADGQSEMAGGNVKKLCSESELIGGDALPQSSVGTKEEAAPDSSLVQNTDDVPCINSLVGTQEDYDKRSLDDGVDAAVSDNNDGVELHDSLKESDLIMPLPVYDDSDESEATMPLPESEKQPDNDVTEPGLQASQSSDNPKLDESCIRVGDTGLQSIPYQEAKCRSYKKKIKAAFASTLGLLKNHNHRDHADQSGDLHIGFDQQQARKSFTTSAVSEKSNSPDYGSCESEWEIV